MNWLADRALPVLVYGKGHPYANPADGYAETVKALTLDDVKAFHAEQIGPRGATLIVVGDVEPEALFAMLESTIGRWTARSSGPAPRPAARLKADPGAIYLVDKPGAVQSIAKIGRPWVDRSDPSYDATLVGNRILGGDFLSRLNQNLREKNGFTYGVASDFRYHRSGSLWTVETAVRTDATAPALKEVLGELDGAGGARPFTEREIAMALGAEVKSFPERFESPSSIAAVLRELAEFHLPPEYLDTFLARLQATSPEEVRKTMSEVVAPSQRATLVVGDRTAVEPKLRAMGYSRIQPVTVDVQRLAH